MAQNCPVCLSEHTDQAEVYIQGGLLAVRCNVCGKFKLTEDAWDDFLDPQTGPGSRLSSVSRARLSHRIRIAITDRSDKAPVINSDFVKRFIADGCPGPTPADQATNLIAYVGDKIAERGEKLRELPNDLYSIIGAPNPTFANELAIELINRGVLSGNEYRVMGGEPPSVTQVGLTLSGWQAYEAEKTGKFSGKYGFMAMKFEDEVLDPLVTDIVKPAIKKGIGYNLIDMRDVAKAGIIDNIMRAQIRDSAFVIVDLTHDNAGAYWEAGYAEGLGKPVVYICEQAKFDQKKTHFDTNHCTTVPWTVGKESEFTSKLVATLRRSLNLFDSAG